MNNIEVFEVVIIGGSYSGQSAAMALGRAMRNVLVIDGGKPCNTSTPHSHNFITQDGSKPQEILAIAKKQVAAYSTISQVNDQVISIVKQESFWLISTAGGQEYISKILLFSTGLKDLLYNEPGFKECWGNSIIHCPYCHGYEYANRPTFILSNSDTAFEMVKMLSNWSKEINILTNGIPQFTEEQTLAFKKHSVKIIDKHIDSYIHDHGKLEQVKFTDGSIIEANVVYARPPFEQHCKIPQELGCELTEQGLIKVDPFLKTTIDSVYASGDCTTFLRSVANSVAMGSLAGVAINRELTEAEF
jgi:thioredoxin reductase